MMPFEFASHAGGHGRDVPLDRTSPLSLMGACLLDNLGVPSCPLCLAAWRRRSWCMDLRDVQADRLASFGVARLDKDARRSEIQ